MPPTVRSVRRRAISVGKQDQGAALDPPRAPPLEPILQAQGTSQLCGTRGHSNFALTARTAQGEVNFRCRRDRKRGWEAGRGGVWRDLVAAWPGAAGPAGLRDSGAGDWASAAGAAAAYRGGDCSPDRP